MERLKTLPLGYPARSSPTPGSHRQSSLRRDALKPRSTPRAQCVSLSLQSSELRSSSLTPCCFTVIQRSISAHSLPSRCRTSRLPFVQQRGNIYPSLPSNVSYRTSLGETLPPHRSPMLTALFNVSPAICFANPLLWRRQDRRTSNVLSAIHLPSTALRRSRHALQHPTSGRQQKSRAPPVNSQ